MSDFRFRESLLPGTAGTESLRNPISEIPQLMVN
jgi:hypothetical protein